jgi:dolichyl-phosphate-mannose-protein mannosyltransferase
LTTTVNLGSPRRADWRVIGGLSFGLILLHMLFNGRYGYFVDELYYLACSHHLDWGYVDQAPLIALVTWFERVTLGDSLHALRFLPALAAGCNALLAGLIAAELGARRYAQALACVAVIVAPLFLGLDNLLTMNAFEPLFWMGCALITIKIINGASPRLWLLFGLLAGIGLQNKHSMLFFGFALFVGLLLTPERRLLRSPWIWLGGIVAVVIFLPNLLWEIHRNFPTLELLRNVQRSGRNVSLSAVGFLAQQLLLMHPLSAPLWIAGLWYFFRDADGRRFRALGWTYVVILLCMLVLNGRVYYLAPAYPMLFAAGAVVFQRSFERWSLTWLKPAYVAALLVAGALLAPFAYFPLLPVEGYIAYSKALHFGPPKIETHEEGPLPQIYADMYGWKEMAESVAGAYNKLSPEDKHRCAIFGQNYGQAGAIDFFGAKIGLPNALSGHQSYYYWGPRGYTGECVLVLGDSAGVLEQKFDSVEKVATVYHPYSMPYQHFDVFLCRGPRFGTLQQAWPKLKHWN